MREGALANVIGLRAKHPKVVLLGYLYVCMYIYIHVCTKCQIKCVYIFSNYMKCQSMCNDK